MEKKNDKPVVGKCFGVAAGNSQDIAHMAASLDSPLTPEASKRSALSRLTGELLPEGGGCASAEAIQAEDCVDIAAALAGDGEGYSRLMCRHEAVILRQMWRFTRDANERDELVQEVFVEAYLSLRSYRQKAPFTHWLRTIAVRRGFRFWKQREKQKKLVPLEEWDGAAKANDDPPPQEAGRLLSELLQRLKPEERVVMTLEYLEGNNVEQTARLLGWTQAMVKMRAYRAKKKLREMYERSRKQEAGS